MNLSHGVALAAVVTGCLGTAVPLTAQNDSLFHALVADHGRWLSMADGEARGAGWEFLVDEGTRARFFSIGEDHGVSTIPQLTGALFRVLVPYGYRHLAIEVSPLMAQHLEDRVRGASSAEAFVSWAAGNGLRIPFFSMRQEAKLLYDAAQLMETDTPLFWGLDQEFIASSELAFAELRRLAATSSQREVAEAFRRRAAEGMAQAVPTGDPSKVFLASANTSDFRDLRRTFAGNDRALALIQELAISAEIYQLWFARQIHRSNDIRERLMKRHFMHYFAPSLGNRDPPRVLFKFGANHVYRGQKPGTRDWSLGNFVSELANGYGWASFHLRVMAGPGSEALSFSPDGARVVPATAWEESWMAPLMEHVADDGWTVIDLRPLRHPLQRGTIEVPGELEALIWGFDAIAVLPASPASTLGAP